MIPDAMEPHLKPYEHYSLVYDRHTVESCRWWLANATREDAPVYGGDLAKDKIKDPYKLNVMVAEVRNACYEGERAAKKAETIREWMRRDEERDRLYETAQPPGGIHCLSCGRTMSARSKHLDLAWEGKPDRVMFLFDCPLGHRPSRVFYNTGEEWKREELACPECRSILQESSERTGSKIVTTRTCPACGHKETDELDLSPRPPKPEPPDPDFKRDRALFCKDEEYGRRYVEGMVHMKTAVEHMEKEREREREKPLYDAVAKLKRLKVAELETLLAEEVGKHGFTKFSLKDPEIGKDVIVPFITYEAKAGRDDRAGAYDLAKLIRKMLEGTTWRLMSDGVSCRLGALSGRLRGYEREEDLVALVRKS